MDLFPEDPLRRVLDEGIVWEDAYHESIEKGVDSPLAEDVFFTKHAGYYVPTKDTMA